MGRRSKALPVADGLAVIRSDGHFHIFFLTLAPIGSSFLLATMTDAGWAHRELSTSDAETLLDGRPLLPSAWERFSLVAGILAIVLFALGSSLLRHR
ncbi:MAG: hypothetical protein M3Z83_07580 [Actinomycetota bacterium]|nr:hypothetical protein [Actinomycetota bacterium]